MTSNELRQKYLEFFRTKQHAIIPSASLIPDNDPTVLFTTAGMHPLVPYLMGEKHPAGTRLVNSQKCIRTGDIEEVGDTTHHTFFEMLGNWSLGDYFKKEAIEWSWEFLTSSEWLGLDKNRLACSVFEGDQDAPLDAEALAIWKNLGMPEARIAKLPKKNNWWGPAGETGPCGPDSEMFYWVGAADKVPASFNDDNDLWVEIWNDVFMQFNKQEDGSFAQLAKQNVDTGMGLVRVLAVVNGLADNYQTEVFAPVIKKIEELSGCQYQQTKETEKAMRVIADHITAATFIMGDANGIAPSNTDRGYVLRRLIRRAIRYGKIVGIRSELWTTEIAQVVVGIYKDVYPELQSNQVFVMKELSEEEIKFKKTLEVGEKEAEKIFTKYLSEVQIEGEAEHDKLKTSGEHANSNMVSGVDSFNLFQSFGFPLEMVEELALEKGLVVDRAGFNSELEKHQELSRTASAGMFKGGLADASDETKRLHTAAHLMLAGLRKVLGDHVWQKGSNITAERLRYDFSHAEKMTAEEIQAVEQYVNDAISKNLPVVMEEMTVEEAKAGGALGVFSDKYGEKVKVYTVGDENFIASKEICGGPHVDYINELGHFKIIKEESSSSGVRRIKATLN